MTTEIIEFKEKNPDAIIILRAGDNYEICDEDAKAVAGCLSLPIDEGGTMRFKFSELDTYLPKLYKAGHRIAIFDKLEPKFEFTEDWENDGMLTWKNAKTISHYKALQKERDSVNVNEYDCFFAFSNEQFAEGLKKIRPLKESEKLVQFSAGGYGTKDGVERITEYFNSFEERIKKECDPQEIYCYEYNNYESCIAYDGDLNAIRLIADIWGVETAKKIKRINAFYSIDSLFV